MAQTPVTVQIDGYKDREVLKVEYSFEQATDDEGQMTGIPRGGQVSFRVKALNDGTPDLMAWMLERNLPKTVTVTFLETKTNKQMKQYVFEGCYCIDYEENWTDKQEHVEDFKITCQKMKFAKAEYQNAWN